MHDVLQQIQRMGIVPVIQIDDVEKAVPLAKALADGGLPCAEITFRTAEGEESIRRIAKELPTVLVGAGTVLNCEQVDRAVDAGARFVVTPGYNPDVVAYCVKKGIPVTPGCSNPSDMERAIAAGLEVVKFFPAEPSGGIGFIKAVSAPYPMLRFIPTGGINAANLNSYLAFDRVLACGGSWMVKAELIKAGRFDEITRLAREAVFAMLGLELAHLGLNCENEAEARATAQTFELLFNMPVKEGNSSIFAGGAFECMKAPYLGRRGHIAIGSKNIMRAVAYFKRSGVAVDESTAKYDDKGALAAVYLKNEVAGFAIHLVQLK